MSGHEHMLEHFMVNHLFRTAFPLSYTTSFFPLYMQAAVLFSILNTLLVGLCLQGRKLTEELLIEVVHSVSYSVLHHPTYLTDSVKEMCAKGQDTMAHMAALIAD